MRIDNVLERLDQGINALLENESDNLRRGLGELNLSTHLANYLTPLFPDHNVDPEYNGDFDKPNDRKALAIAERRIREIGKSVKETNIYPIIPDIIIHRRRTNDHNLVVIEVKKDIHPENHKDWDLIKLEHLTIDYLGNHYNYKLGVAIVFGTMEDAGKYSLRYFQNGREVAKGNLK